ncbi:hypothetical protein CHISP_0593 [Chitinispirillum alkaliphilum]|nr:hypothetical protein CHISP_0593 [Chitinispirillum alkaliphilum]
MNRRKINRVGVAVMMFLTLTVTVFPVQARDMLARYINDVKAGPSIYYTPEAAQYYHRTAGLSVSADRNAAEKSYEAMIKLAEMGMVSSPAIPTIVDKFPTAVHVSTVSGARFTGNEPFEDWLSAFIVSAKNNFLLSAPFLNIETMNICESFIEVSHTTDFRERSPASGNTIRSAVVDINIIFKVHVGACMLSRITGISGITSAEGWRHWLNENRHTVSGVDTAPTHIAPHVHGHSNLKDFVENGRYRLMMVSRQDIEGEVISVDGDEIIFHTTEDRRFRLNRNQIFRSRLLALPEQNPEQSQQQGARPVQTSQTTTTTTRTVDGEQQGRIWAFEDLNLLRENTELRVRLNNGSLLIGTLHSFDNNVLTVEMLGLRIPLRNSVVEEIVVFR